MSRRDLITDLIRERGKQGLPGELHLVAWYKPEEKLPPVGTFVVVCVSGRIRKNCQADHTIKIGAYYDDSYGWELVDYDMDEAEFEVHAWCDLAPYGMEEEDDRKEWFYA